MKSIKEIAILALVLLIYVSCAKENYKIQNDPDLFAVYPVAIPVAAEGGEYQINITGKEAWKIRFADSNSKGDWCSIDQMSGEGSGILILTVKPSTSFVKNRMLTIEVEANGKVLKSKVLQETMTLGENEVLINGQVWSTVNLSNPGEFVSSPDEIGMYYQFNRKQPWPSVGAATPEGWPENYINDNTDWTKENDPCPEGWRVPKTEEMVALWEIGATWVTKEKTGFARDGIIVGIPTSVAQTATKENLKSLGGIFLPQSGWRSESGVLDRDWLVAVRSGKSLSGTHGGLSLGDSGGYRDVWGWGDGQKARAAMIRPVKDIIVEE